MENGKFTKEEREYLLALDAVDEVRAKSIVYSKGFKEECMLRYHAGEKPGAIFAGAGMPSSLIGYKRMERAIYHWKEAERKDAPTSTEAPQVRHRNRIDTIKREKREAVARQREIREREVAEMEERLAKQKARAKTREERVIAAQAARIAALEAQVKALKALGTLARKTQRAPQTTEKSERFELISRLKAEDPRLKELYEPQEPVLAAVVVGEDPPEPVALVERDELGLVFALEVHEATAEVPLYAGNLLACSR